LFEFYGNAGNLFWVFVGVYYFLGVDLGLELFLLPVPLFLPSEALDLFSDALFLSADGLLLSSPKLFLESFEVSALSIDLSPFEVGLPGGVGFLLEAETLESFWGSLVAVGGFGLESMEKSYWEGGFLDFTASLRFWIS
jgi:hypothetical protein